MIETISVPAPRIRRVKLTLQGISPLICHNWDEKAKREMLDKQMQKAKTKKEAKVPEDAFRKSLYVVPGREDDPDGTPGKYFFPATQK